MGNLVTSTYEQLAGAIDEQSWTVGSAEYAPADTMSVWRWVHPWAARDPRGHPVMEQTSYAALAHNYRIEQARNAANQQSGLWRGPGPTKTSSSQVR